MQPNLPRRVLICTALPVEFGAVRRYLDPVLDRDIDSYGTVTYEADHYASAGSHWAVRVLCTGPKNPNAGVVTAIAADEFNPDYVFFVGVAGSVRDVSADETEIRLGDVVVASVVYPFTGKSKRRALEIRPHSLLTAYELQQAVQDLKSEQSETHHPSPPSTLPPDYLPALNHGYFRIVQKPIISTDLVITSRSSALFRQLVKSFPDAYAFTMEDFGFLTANWIQHRKCLVIRALSDNLEGKSSASDASMQPRAALNAAAVVFAVIDRIAGPKTSRTSVRVRRLQDSAPSPASHSMSGSLVDWCVERVLEDQFDSGAVAGGWGRKFERNIRFLLGNSIPPDSSIRDSITYSTWNCEALVHYRSLSIPPEQQRAIAGSLHAFWQYLVRHWDPASGGFGMHTSVQLGGHVGVHVELRHTVWAVMALLNMNRSDSTSLQMIEGASSYIAQQLRTRELGRERSITLAAVHRLLRHEGNTGVVLPAARRTAIVKQIENYLVESYDPILGSWEETRQDTSRGLDVASIVLFAVDVRSCHDAECASTITSCLTGLLRRVTELDGGRSGLALYPGGRPEIGVTLLLLWLLKRNRDFVDLEPALEKRLFNFVLDPSEREANPNFAYSWHVSTALLLTSELAGRALVPQREP